MTWALPLTDASLSDAEVEAYLDALKGGWLTMGPRTQEFEGAFGTMIGVNGCLAVSSGAAGLQLALLALGVGAEDEVIVPAFTFVAAANAVLAVGARPVFCDAISDVDPVLGGQDVVRLVSSRTKAAILTHPFGIPAASESVAALCREQGIHLIEDCTTAIGARVAGTDRWAGAIGDVGVFSFRSGGPMPLGEGGMVAAGDETVAGRVRLLRSHAMTSVTWDRHRGHATSYDVVDIGFNYRLDEPRSAMGTRMLASLEQDVERRRALAARYREGLNGVSWISMPWSEDVLATAAPWGFAIVVDDRDALRRKLTELGIETSAQPAVTQLSRYRGAGECHRAEAFADRHCVVPLSSLTTEDDVDVVVSAISAA
jgi:dTDP-4-amino-4,6-dideoxygalactose transaminase